MKDIVFVGKGVAVMSRDDLFRVGKTENEILQTDKRWKISFHSYNLLLEKVLTLNKLYRSEKKTGIAIKVKQSLSNCPRLSDDDCVTLKGLFWLKLKFFIIVVNFDYFMFLDFYMMQNIPSTLCGHILDPKLGDKILDMCAAPGSLTNNTVKNTDNGGQKNDKKSQQLWK